MTSIDDSAIEAIAERVAEMLRAELETIAGQLAVTNGTGPPLTVDEVARRFGVARSTVYAHWREWGGYKLGPSEKAPIRFANARLPTAAPAAPQSDKPVRGRPGRRRRRQALISDTPRLSHVDESRP